jgi:hypothetical protein
MERSSGKDKETVENSVWQCGSTKSYGEAIPAREFAILRLTNSCR